MNKIDSDDKQTLTNKLNKLKKDFIDNIDKLNINNLDTINNDIKIIFEPIKKFYNPINSKSFIKTTCLDNIHKEIEHVFKLKNYIKLMDDNSWVRKLES